MSKQTPHIHNRLHQLDTVIEPNEAVTYSHWVGLCKHFIGQRSRHRHFPDWEQGTQVLAYSLKWSDATQQRALFNFNPAPIKAEETDMLAGVINRFVEKAFSDSQLQVRVTFLQRRVEELEQQVSELWRDRQGFIQLIQELHPTMMAFPEGSIPEINWDSVLRVTQETVSALHWDATLTAQPDQLLVRITVPKEQEDLLVNTTFDFYEKLAGRLDKDVFRAVTFDFTVNPNNGN